MMHKKGGGGELCILIKDECVNDEDEDEDDCNLCWDRWGRPASFCCFLTETI